MSSFSFNVLLCRRCVCRNHPLISACKLSLLVVPVGNNKFSAADMADLTLKLLNKYSKRSGWPACQSNWPTDLPSSVFLATSDRKTELMAASCSKNSTLLTHTVAASPLVRSLRAFDSSILPSKIWERSASSREVSFASWFEKKFPQCEGDSAASWLLNLARHRRNAAEPAVFFRADDDS